jgi:cyclopropane fatty-acyl-phospholipid synthase-like methyltransferase
MGPLSGERADRLVRELAGTTPRTVLDVGCGWGELLLRLAEAVPDLRGAGVDRDGPDIARGRSSAARRGLADRVTFTEAEAEAGDRLESADLVLNLGAYQAFGNIEQALRTLKDLVNPGGILLFGAEFWERPPTAERLAHMWPGASEDDCTDLAGLVDQAVAAGFRPVDVQTATTQEWEEFESGLAADGELWLASHAGHPEAAALRDKLDRQRRMWLNGHRGFLGFAYLTLIRPDRAA